MSLVSPIQQGSIIKIYEGVAWDSTLENIRWFTSESERSAYLSPKVAGVWQSCSVVKTGKSIRVQALYNDCIDCNYLSFVNPNMGDTTRTYYAWVTSVNYVNAQTVEIEYEIDWIQTYMFDYVFESCLVEREHVSDDTFGLHVVPEDFDTGEYIVDDVYQKYFEPAAILFYVAKDNYSANVKDNMYLPGNMAFGTLSDMSGINNALETFNDTPERITSLFMGVTNMIGGESTFFSTTFTTGMSQSFHEGSDSYVPQNKKSLIYPYKLCTLDNLQGDVEQFRWEDSNTKGSLTFAVEGAAMPKPSMVCFPINYKDLSPTSDHDNQYSQQMVVYNNFPSCPYITDSYAAWVSQYGTSKAITQAASVLTGLATLGSSLATGNIAGMVAGGSGLVSQITSYSQEKRDHQIHSLQQHGSISESGLQYARDMIGFRATQYSIKNKAAKRIDGFFTRYGYKVDEVKVPNITGRQYVNYVKCKSGHVGGNIAVDAKLAMERALTQGTSFWHINNIDGELTSNPIVSA